MPLIRLGLNLIPLNLLNKKIILIKLLIDMSTPYTADICGTNYPFPTIPSNPCDPNVLNQSIINWASPIDNDPTIPVINGFNQGCNLISPEWGWVGTGQQSTSHAVYRTDNLNPLPPNVPNTLILFDHSSVCTAAQDNYIPVNNNLYTNNNCQRNSFNGDLITCCLNNYTCNTNNDSLCWSDSERQETCDPQYRQQQAPGCDEPMRQYCSGADLDVNDTSWTERWTSGPCHQYLVNKLFYNSNQCSNVIPVPNLSLSTCNVRYDNLYSAEGMYTAKLLMQDVLNNYHNQESLFKNNDFTNLIFNNVCCPFGGVCDIGLDDICASVNTQVLESNPSLTKWCGCHLTLENYQNYSTMYNIPQECTPMCNKDGVVGFGGPDGNAIACERNICLIDNVSLNLTNTKVGDSVDFNQVCGACTGGNCYCVISNTTVNLNDSTVGGRVIPVNNNCSNVSCNTNNNTDIGPSIVSGQCNVPNGLQVFQNIKDELDSSTGRTALIVTIVIIVLGILFILLLFWIVMRRPS